MLSEDDERSEVKEKLSEAVCCLPGWLAWLGWLARVPRCADQSLSFPVI